MTGLWNVAENVAYHGMYSTWWVTLFVKLLVVAASGISAFAHLRAQGTLRLAIWGSLTSISALAAVFLGVMLHG